MANEEQLAMLKRSVEEWNGWRKENRYLIVNLIAADLCAADLRAVDLHAVYLRDANLSDADLSYANLSDADLSSVNFRSADLSSVNFHSADLSAANLSSADLSAANFHSADLSAANFHFANLSAANLSSARLNKTKFNRTIFWYTLIDNLDLRKAENLEAIDHEGSSSISINTFKKSQGQIPKAFLKGIGLADWEIEAVKLYNPNLTASQITDIHYKMDELRNTQPIQLYPVFLSHSWSDKPFTRKLYEALDKRGVRCWLDEKQMTPGTKIIKGIDEGIRAYDKLILICSEASLTSWWVEREIERILKKERELNKGKKAEEWVDLLIPLTLDNYIFDTWDSAWKTEVDRYVVGDGTGCMEDAEKFNRLVEQVVRALQVNGREDRPPSYLPKKKK